MFLSGTMIARTGDQIKQNRLWITFYILLGAILSMVIAYLVVKGLWPIAAALLGGLPVFVLLHRYPLTGVLVWLLLTPFLVATNGGTVRKIYWLVHRLLPVTAVILILLSSMLKIHHRRLPRPSLAELCMAAYLLVSFLSVIYLSDNVSANTIYIYDRILAPMCLFLLIRLSNTTASDLRRFIPVLILILISQSAIGILSWTAPQFLPSAWHNRIGLRTTGSLQSYSVFSVTVFSCGLLILHFGQQQARKRHLYNFLFGLACLMVFLSFSRGSWLAGLVTLTGLAFLYPRFMGRFALTLIPLTFLILSIGLLSSYSEWAQERFYSDQSEEAALSRLPVYYASLQMFASKPLFGWGYGNFDRFDRQFQARVGDLISPEKDHASHNLYLTLASEQGAAGLLLYLGPLLWCLFLTLRALPRLPADGFWSRKLLLIFWLMITFHFIVNNFSNMRVVFGLGMWWLTMGLIAAISSTVPDSPPDSQTAVPPDHLSAHIRSLHHYEVNA